MVTWSNLHPEDPQIFRAIERNVVARAIWFPGFVHRWHTHTSVVKTLLFLSI